MKKIVLSTILTMILTWGGMSALYAQNPMGSQEEVPAELTPEELTKAMTKSYNLNADQAKAVGQLNELRANQLAEIDKALGADATAEQKVEAKKIRAEIQASYEEMLQNLMSEKQFEKYQADEAEKREKIKGNVNWIFNMASRRLGSDVVNLLGWNGEISDSTKIATEATEKLVRKYKLTDEQKEKVQALNVAEVSAEIAERRNVTLEDASPNEIAEKVQEFVEMAQKRSTFYEGYLKTIMNEEQYKKYTNAKKAGEARRNSRQFGGPQFGGPRYGGGYRRW